MTDVQKTRTFDDAVKRLMLELRRHWFYKPQDGLRCLDEDIAKGLRPLFDEQQATITSQAETIKECRSTIGLHKVAVDQLAGENKRLREVIIRFDRHSHGEETDADALLNELDKAMKSFALAAPPGSEEE